TAKFAKDSQSSPRPVLPMLPFPLTLLSVSNSNHLRAFLAPCELDVRRKSSRSRLRTPARQGRLAFLPEALAMTGAPDSATSIRRYREALVNETRHHTFQKHNQAGRARAPVGQTNTHFSLVGTQHGIRAGQRLEDRVIHMNAGAIHGGYDILSSA